MATSILSASKTVNSIGASAAYKFYYDAVIDSQSIADNTSTITFKFGIGPNISNYYYSGWDSSNPGVTLYYSTDNSNWTSLGFTVIGSTSGSNITYVAKSFSVAHADNGSRTIYLRAVYTHGTATAYYMPVDDTYTSSGLTLTTIPRASSISIASTHTITSSSGALSYTITPKASFYHKVVWTLSGSSTTLNKTTAISAATSYSDITKALMLGKITSGKTAILTVTLYTYSDSALTTQVGSAVSANCSITVDTSTIKPSISLSDVTKNSGNLAILVAGYSTAKTTTTITNATGASTSSISWSVNTGSISSSTTAQAITNTLPSSTSDYTLTFTATVTDSRGATASASVSAKVYGYSVPSFTLNAYRCVSTSDTTADGAGAAACYSRSEVTYKALKGNSLTCTFKRGTTSISTAATEVTGSVALATTASLTFTATAYDTVLGSSNPITKTVTIAMASYPLDLYQSGSTVGVGLGQIAEAGKVSTPLSIISTKTGGGTSAAFQILNSTANTETEYLAKRTDTGKGVSLLVGSGGTNRGLYDRSDSNEAWLIYYDDSYLRFNKPAAGSSLSLSGALTAQNVTASAEIQGQFLACNNTAGNGSQIRFRFSDKSNNVYGLAYLASANNGGRFAFREYSGSSATTLSGYYEQYWLPSCNASRTSNAAYDILTSKSAVTVAQGGTGVTAAVGSVKRPVYLTSSAITACTAFTSLYSGSLTTGSTTLTNAYSNYNFLIVMGTPNSSNPKATAVIPTALLTTSDVVYSLGNESAGIAFKLKYSGNNVVLTWNAGSGGLNAITNVYGGV